MSERVPERWKKAKFGDLAKVLNGYAFQSLDFTKFSKGNYPVIRMSNLKRGKIDHSDSVYVKKQIISGLEQFQLKAGDLVFGMSGSISNYGIIRNSDGICYQNQRVGRLKPKNSDSRFVTQLFLSDQISRQIEILAAGGAQVNISSNQIENLDVLSPPLPEQKKIASILTSVDEIIENTQKQIDKLQDLKKATMNELLTKGIGHTEFKDSELGRIPKSWDVVSISDLAFIDRESLSSSTSPDYQFFYIDITSVKTCFINIPSTKIRYSDSPSRARRVVRKGDVLLSTVRPNLKAFAYVENDCFDWVCSTGFSVLSPKNGNDGRFIFYSILSGFVTKQIEALVVGSNYPAINSTDVKSLLVLQPPLSEQKNIASTLNSIDVCIKNKQHKLHKTQHLKKALMQDLLTGKIRVKVN